MKPQTPAQALENYIAAWNAVDADDCSSRLLAACASDVVLLDPQADRPLNGWAAIASHIAYFREHHGHRMEPTGHLEAHHGVCRLSWRFAAGPQVLYTGMLIAEGSEDGRLKRIIHFVDAPAPPAA